MGAEFFHSTYAVEEWFSDEDCQVNTSRGQKKRGLETEEMLKHKFDVVYGCCGDCLGTRVEDKRRWQC
jgi:hypothetical protein